MFDGGSLKSKTFGRYQPLLSIRRRSYYGWMAICIMAKNNLPKMVNCKKVEIFFPSNSPSSNSFQDWVSQVVGMSIKRKKKILEQYFLYYLPSCWRHGGQYREKKKKKTVTYPSSIWRHRPTIFMYCVPCVTNRRPFLFFFFKSVMSKVVPSPKRATLQPLTD